MEFLIMFVVLGAVGGASFAFWLAKLNREAPPRRGPVSPRHTRFSTDIINMAHIRVAGVGGLGLVVMSFAVALYIPSIGVSIGVGLGLGILLAMWLIAQRRKAGPMPSSGRQPGANVTLQIETSDLPPVPPNNDGPAAQLNASEALGGRIA